MRHELRAMHLLRNSARCDIVNKWAMCTCGEPRRFVGSSRAQYMGMPETRQTLAYTRLVMHTLRAIFPLAFPRRCRRDGLDQVLQESVAGGC